MTNTNQANQSINNFSTDAASIKLFETISDEKAETIKGGFWGWLYDGSHLQSWRDSDDTVSSYCHKTKVTKTTLIGY